MLLPLIGVGIPKSLLEGFPGNKANTKQKCIHPPTAIMSAVGWHFDEEFKVFAAESAEKGTKLLGVQHGGGYGLLKYFLQEAYELSIADKYFTWGWSKETSHAKLEPVSATKLVKVKQRKKIKKSNDILYVTDSTFYRFLINYPLCIDAWKGTLEKESAFLSNLSKGVKERLVIRPHREDGGMDYNERFRDIIADVKIETWTQPFSQRDYGLLVCDHPCYATTFIESFVKNKPAIIFTFPHFAENCFNDQAMMHWNRFKAMGIAFDDPAEAAKKIDEIYENIDGWWMQPERQEAVRLFLSEFGYVSDQWEKEWATALEKVLA